MTGIVEKSESYDGIVGTRLSRRAALMGLASTAALLATPAMWPKSAKAAGSSLSFAELTRIYDQTHHVAPDYNANILIRWGDPIARDVTFDPAALTADSQAKQFGYNCDFIGYMPLPVGSGNSEHGLLCVNNEYPDPHLMWPGMTEDDGASKLSDDQIRVMQAAWGHSVVEIKKEGGAWSYVQNSEYNRRINGFTEMSISGPAAGHALLKTRPIRPAPRPSAPATTAPAAPRRGAPSSPARRACPTPSAAIRPRLRMPSCWSATAMTAPTITAWRGSSRACISTRSRTSPTASTGWWRSIPISPVPRR